MNQSLNEIQNQEWRQRLRLLADFIFASSMTILVLNLEIPSFDSQLAGKELVEFFIKQLSRMAVVIITFVVISVYWIKHLEIFSMIPKISQRFIWLQLFYLLFMILLPFWNTYVTLYPDKPLIKAFFSLNMILVGVFSYLSWNFATKPAHRLVHPDVDEKIVATYKKQIMTEPIIAFAAAGIGFINPNLWDVTFISVPVFFALRKRVQKVNYFKINLLRKNQR